MLQKSNKTYIIFSFKLTNVKHRFKCIHIALGKKINNRSIKFEKG